jgi:hypothetical protein
MIANCATTYTKYVATKYNEGPRNKPKVTIPRPFKYTKNWIFGIFESKPYGNPGEVPGRNFRTNIYTSSWVTIVFMDFFANSRSQTFRLNLREILKN